MSEWDFRGQRMTGLLLDIACGRHGGERVEACSTRFGERLSAEIIVWFYDADLKTKLPTDPLLCGRADKEELSYVYEWQSL